MTESQNISRLFQRTLERYRTGANPARDLRNLRKLHQHLMEIDVEGMTPDERKQHDRILICQSFHTTAIMNVRRIEIQTESPSRRSTESRA